MMNWAMASEHNEYKQAVSRLKEVLRQQKITYRELARGIAMSESGVKKVLSSADGSFRRLGAICKYAGITLAELLQESSGRMLEVSFSDRQQEFLVKNPRAFQFYWKLVYERVAPNDVTVEWGLSEKEFFKLARQLDTHGLVELRPGGRLRVPPVQQIKWVGDGPLVRKLYQEWSRRLIESLAHPAVSENRLFIIRYLKMTPKTYLDFLQAQRNLEAEFVRRAIGEMRAEAKGLHHVRWVAGIDDQSFL